MWKLNNSELETNTYERKHGLVLFKLASNKFTLTQLARDKAILHNPNKSNVLIPSNELLTINKEELSPVSANYFYIFFDISVDLTNYGFTQVYKLKDLVINNTFYISENRSTKDVLVHSTSILENLTITNTFQYLVTQDIRSSLDIDLSSINIDIQNISRVMGSGLLFTTTPEPCNSYYSFNNTTKVLTLQVCSNCRFIKNNYLFIDLSFFLLPQLTYTAYKFALPNIDTLIELTYKSDIYTLQPTINNLGIIHNSERSECLCLKR